MHSKLQRPSSKSSSEVCVQDSRGYVVGDEICARLPYYHSHRQNQHKQDEARLQSSIHPTTSSGCRQLTQVLWLVVVQDRGCSPRQYGHDQAGASYLRYRAKQGQPCNTNITYHPVVKCPGPILSRILLPASAISYHNRLVLLYYAQMLCPPPPPPPGLGVH